MAFFDPIPGDLSRARAEGWHADVARAVDVPLTWHVLVSGTRIMTPAGAVAVDQVAKGTIVSTRRHGAQGVLDIRHWALPRQSLIAAPRLTPVSIGQSALGNGLPDRGIWVHPSTQVRAGTDQPRTRRAMDIVGDGDVRRVFPDGTTYVALQLAADAEVLSEGLWLGPQHHFPHM